MSKKVFEYEHCNSSMTQDAVCIDDFITAFEEHVKFFKELRDAGVEIDHEESYIRDDLTVFTTTDESVATKFGFTDRDSLDFDYDDDDCIEPDYMGDLEDDNFNV